MNFDKKLGKFFKFGELIRYRADNIPTNEELINLTQLCICVLDKIREKFGAVIITSGYRYVYIFWNFYRWEFSEFHTRKRNYCKYSIFNY